MQDNLQIASLKENGEYSKLPFVGSTRESNIFTVCYVRVSSIESREQQQHHKYQRNHMAFPHKNLYTFISAAVIKDMPIL